MGVMSELLQTESKFRPSASSCSSSSPSYAGGAGRLLRGDTGAAPPRPDTPRHSRRRSRTGEQPAALPASQPLCSSSSEFIFAGLPGDIATPLAFDSAASCMPASPPAPPQPSAEPRLLLKSSLNFAFECWLL